MFGVVHGSAKPNDSIRDRRDKRQSMGTFTLSAITRIFLLIGFSGVRAFAQETSSYPGWSPAKAAAYLDARSTWWISWPASARDQGTFCVSCHTATPFSLGRASLRGPLGESAVSSNEQKVLDSVTKRVRLWHDIDPFYTDQARGLPKSSESRGTESILNSLILVWRDVPTGRLSADARLALDNMWALQIKAADMNGAWAWLQFHNAPFEGDSQFYGNSLAAIAIGSAPGNYQSEPEIQNGIKLLKAWLVKNMNAQTPLDRVVLLWASTKLNGLLTRGQQNKIIEEILAKQRDDGGFSMSQVIGAWKRHDNTTLNTSSDGYATGLIAFALEQIDAPEGQAPLKRALAWLSRNQIESDGRWPADSLNNSRPVLSDTGLFMSDAATAYAVLALTNAPGREGPNHRN
jgi:squalene-hopene/tetraprenyl-beta-curcumene cyclase